MSTTQEAATGPNDALVRMSGIRKSFYGVEVLHGVDVDLRAGEVHALMGENGAGKSTLMKILVGAHGKDAGTIEAFGEVAEHSHPLEAQHAGVSIIYQEFNLLPDRSVAENVFLGREPTRGWIIDRRRLREETAKLLADLHIDNIDPDAQVGTLSVAQQQMVEIAKALSFDAKVVVMDEPTAALSPHEVDALFERVRLLQSRGVGIFYISHRLNEIFAISQRITVLKDGSLVDTVNTADTSRSDLVRMMVGRELENYFPDRAVAGDVGEARLQVRGGSTDAIHDIELDAHAGVIVGLAGLEGSGRTEIARAIFGADPFDQAQMWIDGQEVQIATPRDAIAHGLGFITEDRKGEGLVLERSVLENVALPLRSVEDVKTKQGAGLRGLASKLLEKLELRGATLDDEVQYLSGGNQQKVVLAKWLATEARILIFDEPTRGIDVGAKAGIHELMRELARSGVAIIMISSELPEIIGMSDRILVMRQGRIAGELPAGASEEDIMFLATGETSGQDAA